MNETDALTIAVEIVHKYRRTLSKPASELQAQGQLTEMIVTAIMDAACQQPMLNTLGRLGLHDSHAGPILPADAQADHASPFPPPGDPVDAKHPGPVYPDGPAGCKAAGTAPS